MSNAWPLLFREEYTHLLKNQTYHYVLHSPVVGMVFRLLVDDLFHISAVVEAYTKTNYCKNMCIDKDPSIHARFFFNNLIYILKSKTFVPIQHAVYQKFWFHPFISSHVSNYDLRLSSVMRDHCCCVKSIPLEKQKTIPALFYAHT